MYLLAIGAARTSMVIAIPLPEVLSASNCLEIFPVLFQITGVQAHVFGIVEHISDIHPTDLKEISLGTLMFVAKTQCAGDSTGKSTLLFEKITDLFKRKGIAFLPPDSKNTHTSEQETLEA